MKFGKIIHKKVKSSVFIILTLNTIGLYAGDYSKYYDLCNKALIYKVQKEYPKAIQLYKKAFNIAFPFPDDVNYLMECYLEMNDKKNAFKAMQLMIKCGYKLVEEVPIVSNRKFLVFCENSIRVNDTVLNNRLRKEYPSLRKQYLKNVDTEIDKWLKSIVTIETFVAIMRADAPSGDDSFYVIQKAGFVTERKLLINLLKSQKKIIRSKTDTWSDNRFITALIHCSLSFGETVSNDSEKELAQEFFSLLKEQVLIGNLHPFQYAEIMDFTCIRQEVPTKYGQHFESELLNNGEFSRSLCNIENLENIDIIRKEVCLPPFGFGVN